MERPTLRTDPSLLLFFSCLALSLLQIHGNKQGDALRALYKAKLESSDIDTSLFQVEKLGGFNELNAKVFPQVGSKEGDRISSLPGQPPVDFSHYGGYVTVDQTAGRAMYYYFAESPRNKVSHVPLLLWLNGGPGCSSLAYGAMQELGPFRVYSDGKTLYRNKYSWNHVANVLFLESPAGVGFSYSNSTSDYKTRGDSNTAEDNLVFLLNWLERFPEYKERDFYIAGESYAGHYVPQLAHSILHYNQKANKTIINLKGILIGNAVINDVTDQTGMYEYFASHALISDEVLGEILKFCDFSPSATSQPSQCMDAANKADHDTAAIDIYNIYAPLCFNQNVTAHPKKASIREFDPCSDYYVYAYLNREDVQTALHANVTKLKYDWEPCSNVLESWGDSPSTVIPLLEEFMSHALRVWVFSGDTDGRVPVTSTKESLKKMHLPTKEPWRAWFNEQEVGGYVQVYKGDLTFATVRGAGHQVPSYQPKRALALIAHFIEGTPLPPH